MSESCEQFRSLLPEYWSGAISVNQHKEVEQHMAGCTECRAESDYLKRVWTNLDLIPAEAPSPLLRSRFYESLDAYRRGAEESAREGRVPNEQKAPGWWTRGWWARPAF